MGAPIDRTTKAALDSNLVNGITSDAPKVKGNNDTIYNYVDGLNNAIDTHAGASTLPHADGSVVRAKLANKVVGPVQLDDLAVGQAHHQDNGIPSRALPDNVILNRHMSDNSVGSVEIQSGAVQNRHIQDGVLTADKFVPGALTNDTQNAIRITALQSETATVTNVVTGFKADPSGATNSAAAFRDALSKIAASGGGALWIPYGIYKLDLGETLDVPSNCTVYNFGVINLISKDVIAFRAASASNVRVIGGRINGSGVAGAAWAIYFDSCTNCAIEQVTIRNGSSSGVNFASCSSCKVIDCDIQSCYFYGISEKNGNGNVFSHNVLSNNGYGASTTGRGITTWMCDGCEISYNHVEGNNEYGIRVYTESGDASPTRRVLIHGNRCKDNAVIDYYVYANGTPSDVILSNNFATHSVDNSTTAFSIQGVRIKAENNNIYYPGASPSGAGFVLFNAHYCDIKNNKIQGVATAISTSGSSKPTNCTIEGNEAYGIKHFITMFGTNNTIRNNTAVHYATTAVSGEYGYRQGDDSTGCIVSGNKFAGFHSGVLLDYNVDLVLSDNVVRSSVHSSIRSGLTNFHSLKIVGNDWDDFASVEILRSLEVRNGRYLFTATAIPSTGMSGHTFAVGDRAYVRNPAAAGNLEWVCTTAGTPGTWKASGTIEA